MWLLTEKYWQWHSEITQRTKQMMVNPTDASTYSGHNFKSSANLLIKTGCFLVKMLPRWTRDGAAAHSPTGAGRMARGSRKAHWGFINGTGREIKHEGKHTQLITSSLSCTFHTATQSLCVCECVCDTHTHKQQTTKQKGIWRPESGSLIDIKWRR